MPKNLSKMQKRTNRDKPVDICFVLDATESTQSVFTGMIDQVYNLAFDLRTKNRRANFYYGAVIYRDPVDWRPPPPSFEMDADMKREFMEYEANEKAKRIQRLKDKGLYDEELEAEKEENAKHYDREKYPFNQNVPIPFVDDIEELVNELSKVECGGGNDDPEDWVGALQTAFTLNWRDGSKKCLVWISDANAHGEKFCGYDDRHNDQVAEMEPLIRRLVEERFYFVGINVIKKDQGCEITLREIKTMYENFCAEIYTDPAVHPPKFTVEKFEPVYDEDLFGEDGWPADVLEKFMKTIYDTLAKMGDVFDD